MVGMELLMRVRFGSLFRGGAQAIQLVMNNLNKTGVLEVTEEAGKKAAEVMMEVIKAFTVHPEKAVIKVAGKASEFLSGVAQKMGSLAKEAGFGFVSEVVGHHSIEQKREEQVAEAEYRSPTPFRTAPTPLAE